MTKKFQDKILAVTALNLVKMVTKAAEIGHYQLPELEEKNPRYVEQLKNMVISLLNSYKEEIKEVSKETAKFYDTYMKIMITEDKDIRLGLKKWKGGLEIKL